MISARAFLAAALALAPGIANAQASFDAIWCGAENGTAMFLENGHLGFNEHTICDTDTPVAIGVDQPWDGLAHCRNVHVFDRNPDGTFQTRTSDTWTLTLRIAATGPDQLSVSFDGGAAKPYTRCGE